MVDPRKAHVKRVHKMERNPDFPDDPEEMFDDVWVDVLRLDALSVRFQSEHIEPQGLEGQRIIYVFKWNDDIQNPDPNVEIDDDVADKNQFENTNAHRKTQKRLIKDPSVEKPAKGKPQHNVDDNSVSLWIIKDTILDEPRGKPPIIRGQRVKYRFNNEPPDESEEKPSKDRETSPIKVVNNDLGDLKMMSDKEDKTEEGFRKALIIPWENYLEALNNGKKGPDQDPKDELFLTVEVVDKFKVRFQADARAGQEGQIRIFVLANENSSRERRYEQVEDNFEKGDREAKDADGNPALVRLDPLQVVVNVGSNIIAVEFAAGAEGAGGSSEEGGPSLP